MGLPRALRGALIGLLAVALVLLTIYGGIDHYLNSSWGSFPTDEAEYRTPAIQELIWPTIGYPAMIVGGGEVTLEVDLSAGERKAGQPGEVTEWRAAIGASRSELDGLEYELECGGSWKGKSERWPHDSRFGSAAEVWHVEFEVPEGAVPELYDLSIEAETSLGTVSDGQEHALAVVEDDDDNFTYISLADVHVHRRDISTWVSAQTDKGISPEGVPLFFYEAIDQVNLVRPDFVVMLGDYVRAQNDPGDYEIEFENYFRALQRFQVPVFMVPGNHDLYVCGVDGKRVWEENIGPLYYSFDVGDCHFACVNTYQWPYQDRVVMSKFGGLISYPRKWQGQILGAGDDEETMPPEGQPAWLRDDLAAHGESLLRIVLLHHCPFTPEGKGAAFDNQEFAAVLRFGGGGAGREALRKLFSQKKVDLVMSGHRHHDDVGTSPWEEGGGETVYAGQTCVYFDEGGVQDKYPGYRLVGVQEGSLEGLTYTDERHSLPFYDGSNLHGDTDLDGLEREALGAECSESEADGSERLTWEVENYLSVPMELEGLIAEAPAAEEGYYCEGGEIYRVVAVPGEPGRVLLYARTVVRAGEQGESVAQPGTPARMTVTVGAASPRTGF